MGLAGSSAGAKLSAVLWACFLMLSLWERLSEMSFLDSCRELSIVFSTPFWASSDVLDTDLTTGVTMGLTMGVTTLLASGNRTSLVYFAAGMATSLTPISTAFFTYGAAVCAADLAPDATVSAVSTMASAPPVSRESLTSSATSLVPMSKPTPAPSTRVARPPIPPFWTMDSLLNLVSSSGSSPPAPPCILAPSGGALVERRREGSRPGVCGRIAGAPVETRFVGASRRPGVALNASAVGEAASAAPRTSTVRSMAVNRGRRANSGKKG
mmetsp:Transcript_36585/g.93439  ORF Transcript_36585/g.93439 Transcript_36585/m.93439 type:complete len:269 (+) Transcript_36585:438-1244(+)